MPCNSDNNNITNITRQWLRPLWHTDRQVKKPAWSCITAIAILCVILRGIVQYWWQLVECLVCTLLPALQESVYGATLAPCTCITSLQWWTASCSSPAPSTGHWQQCRATWKISSSLRSQTWSDPSSRSSTGYGHTTIQLINSHQATNNSH